MSPLPQRRRCIRVAVLCSFLTACTDRTFVSSDLGRELAERLCPIQDTCDCEMELLISNCETRIERDVAMGEARSRERGLTLNKECTRSFLNFVESLGACDASYDHDIDPYCAAYTGSRDIGESCMVYGWFPLMSDCRRDLTCVEGTCWNLGNPLLEGEICAEPGATIPSSMLGRCSEGLECDVQDSRTCISIPPAPPPPPKTPIGEACVRRSECVDGAYCRPNDGRVESLERGPGTCTPFTSDGEPCTYLTECANFCVDGGCVILPPNPPVLCGFLDEWWLSRELLE